MYNIEDTYVTSGTLNNGTLTLKRNNNKEDIIIQGFKSQSDINSAHQTGYSSGLNDISGDIKNLGDYTIIKIKDINYSSRKNSDDNYSGSYLFRLIYYNGESLETSTQLYFLMQNGLGTIVYPNYPSDINMYQFSANFYYKDKEYTISNPQINIPTDIQMRKIPKFGKDKDKTDFGDTLRHIGWWNNEGHESGGGITYWIFNTEQNTSSSYSNSDWAVSNDGSIVNSSKFYSSSTLHDLTLLIELNIS